MNFIIIKAVVNAAFGACINYVTRTWKIVTRLSSTYNAFGRPCITFDTLWWNPAATPSRSVIYRRRFSPFQRGPPSQSLQAIRRQYSKRFLDSSVHNVETKQLVKLRARRFQRYLLSKGHWLSKYRCRQAGRRSKLTRGIVCQENGTDSDMLQHRLSNGQRRP